MSKLTAKLKDYDCEIGGLTFAMRKLWSTLRTMWRDSKGNSNEPDIQALKNFMMERPKETRLR